MPETNRPRLKVSRAGMVLIKSFESFRPRAVQRDDGRWVIGYGHTTSAREGLTVGEQDAELLLQYDLLPVAKALNEEVETELNQHQFDALASFAVSVGVDRFMSSDVRKRLNAGHAGEAADALVGWPESLSPDAALRRRAAERALFVADPASPVLLSDLLAAPLPPPPVVEPEPEVAPEPVIDPNASRAAAVASLLGETPVALEAPEAESLPEPLAPEPVVAEPVVEAEPEAVAEREPQAETQAEAPRRLPLPDVWQPQGHEWKTPLTTTGVTQFQRYSAYSAAIVGPLPGFPPARPIEPEPEVEAEPAVETEAVVEAALEPVGEVQPEPEAAPELVSEPALIVWPEAPVVEEPVAAPLETFTRIEAPVQTPVFPTAPLFTPSNTPSPFPPLELTPAVEADFAEPAREAWAPEQRAQPDAEETVLFEEEPPLAVLRHEVEPAPARRFGLIETGPYLIMGGLGLFSCAASAAAFRKAVSDPLPTNEFTVIAWVLALIGAICVGVATWNLYVRAGKSD